MYIQFSKRPKSGFGLLEMLVAITLLGVITVGISQLTNNLYRGTTSATRRSALNDTSNLINQTLAFDKTCTASLGTNPFSPALNSSTNPANVKLYDSNGAAGGKILLQAGTVLAPPNGLVIQSLQLAASGPVTGLPNLYYATLTLTAKTPVNNGSLGGQLAPVNFPLIVTVNGGSIAGCWGAPVTQLGPCPGGQVLYGFDAAGNPYCQDPLYGYSQAGTISGLSCPAGQYMTGISLAGSGQYAANCAALSSLSASCGSGYYLTGVSLPAGSATASPTCLTVP